MATNGQSSMSSMKAVRISNYGGFEALAYENVPQPTPREGEVLIRVLSTSVNPFDCAVRAGYLSGYFQHTLPMILGTDVSGIIEGVGEAVTTFKKGDEVYARAGVIRDGAYAEFVAVPASDMAHKPQSIDHIHAAALPHVSLTAWQALYILADLTPGQTVLIHGAAGGVGHIAVQLAKLRGAKVIGTASGNIDFLRELNVDQAIDYSTTHFEEVVETKVDVVLDTIGGETQERSWGILKPGGILISTIQPPPEETALAHEVRQAMVFSTPPIGPTLKEIARLVDSGKLKPHVSSVLPLDEIRKAQEMIEGRHTCGKIVLQIVR
jgi:NADPH:quinone reductase-like Zn-dependent oxidoreductase